MEKGKNEVYSGRIFQKKAGELFHDGYNCSQAVIAVFAEEVGLDMDTAMKFGASFGGGLGKMREVCGAVSGMAGSGYEVWCL